MTITYPRDLPAGDLVECTFVLDDNVTQSASRGLVINRTQVMDPVWRATIETGLMYREQEAIWSAWKKSLRGLNGFIAYDRKRMAPFAYPGAKTPGDISSGWSGTATVTSIGLSGALGLSGLPATYQAKVGDRVGLEQSGRYGYFEVIEDSTATAGALTVTVTPFLQSVFTTAATARLWRPKCKFSLISSTWREVGKAEPTAVSFEAVQIL